MHVFFPKLEFVDLYGKVPFGRDDDGFYWPIQNNYAPPNVFRRTPFDINLTFSDYAAEMNRRMQEEQEKHKQELEAAAAAEKADEQAQGQQGQPRPRATQSKEPEEEWKKSLPLCISLSVEAHNYHYIQRSRSSVKNLSSFEERTFFSFSILSV